MRERKGLWTKVKAGSEISAADKRLRRCIGIDADGRAHEETIWLSFKEAEKDLNENDLKEKEAIITVAEASRRAAEAINGAGSETIN